MKIQYLVRYILQAALRDKILLSFLLTLVICLSLSSFLASNAITEKDQFFTVFASSGIRLASVFTLLIFIVFYVRKAFDLKEVEYMLTKPISRSDYVLSHSLAFTLIAFISAFISSLLIILLTPHTVISGLILWATSFFCELVIISHVAMFFSFTLNSTVSSSLASLAFYVLSRMIGGILGVVYAAPSEGAMIILEKIMLLISIIVPRLDLMSQSQWLIYGTEGAISYLFIFAQLFVFVGLVFFASLFDLKRREF